MITLEQARPYDTALQTNAKMAVDELAKVMQRLSALPAGEMQRVFIAQVYPQLVKKYGARSAAVAAEFYGQVRALTPTLPVFEPIVYTYTPDLTTDVGLTISYIEKQQPIDLITTVASEMLHRRTYEAADNTLDANALADPVRPKRKLIPHPGACAWCGMLAMNEWDSSYEPIPRHSDCKCYVVVDWDTNPDAEGLSRLLKPYQKAYDGVYTSENKRKWQSEWASMSKDEKAKYVRHTRNRDGSITDHPGDWSVYARNRMLQEMNVSLGNTKHTVIDGQ